MRTEFQGARVLALTALTLAMTVGLSAQTTGSSTPTASTPAAQPASGTSPANTTVNVHAIHEGFDGSAGARNRTGGGRCSRTGEDGHQQHRVNFFRQADG